MRLLLPVVDEPLGSAAEPRGGAETHEVRRRVAVAEVSGGVREGLDGRRRMAPACLDVGRRSPEGEAEHLGHEIQATLFGQDVVSLPVVTVAQATATLVVAPREQVLTAAHAGSGRTNADEWAPLAVFTLRRDA